MNRMSWTRSSLVLPGDREQGLLTEVLRLVGDPFHEIEHHEHRQQILDPVAVGVGHPVVVDGIEGALHRISEVHCRPRLLRVTLVECLHRLPQHVGRPIRGELELARYRPRRRRRQLDPFPADGHRVVADPLELRDYPHAGRHPAKMAGARQVANDEAVAQRVNLPHAAVDPGIREDRRIRELPIAAEDRAQGVPDRILRLLGKGPHSAPDLIQIPFQSFFVVAHRCVPSRRRGAAALPPAASLRKICPRPNCPVLAVE